MCEKLRCFVVVAELAKVQARSGLTSLRLYSVLASLLEGPRFENLEIRDQR